MSYILEAIAIPISCSPAVIAECESLRLERVDGTHTATFLARQGRVHFSSHMEGIAQNVSVKCGAAMLIRWDDQRSERFAICFTEGRRAGEFGASDEMFSELDENGYPAAAGPLYRGDELEALDEEYEVGLVLNAIEVACNHSGWCSWDEVKRLIQEHR